MNNQPVSINYTNMTVVLVMILIGCVVSYIDAVNHSNEISDSLNDTIELVTTSDVLSTTYTEDTDAARFSGVSTIGIVLLTIMIGLAMYFIRCAA